ncbi:hypothetical protein SLEP1_g55100 [Rubroshorea leprosula]|uniref:Uncharacterized protein n=1 Tax=Rubroshorea leprosula TaxID=152421 RepID=A0AAV5MEF0_9ROSI|nr:hypothetical protein SLEP1_g55100 [Rubroshorea leprosula]
MPIINVAPRHHQREGLVLKDPGPAGFAFIFCLALSNGNSEGNRNLSGHLCN